FGIKPISRKQYILHVVSIEILNNEGVHRGKLRFCWQSPGLKPVPFVDHDHCRKGVGPEVYGIFNTISKNGRQVGFCEGREGWKLLGDDGHLLRGALTATNRHQK